MGPNGPRHVPSRGWSAEHRTFTGDAAVYVMVHRTSQSATAPDQQLPAPRNLVTTNGIFIKPAYDVHDREPDPVRFG